MPLLSNLFGRFKRNLTDVRANIEDDVSCLYQAAIASFYAITAIAAVIIRDALKVSIAYASERAFGNATTSN